MLTAFEKITCSVTYGGDLKGGLLNRAYRNAMAIHKFKKPIPNGETNFTMCHAGIKNLKQSTLPNVILYEHQKLKKMNMYLKILALITVVLFATACNNAQNTKEKKEANKEQAIKEDMTALKDEFKGVGDAIGDLFKNEQDNFKESANELLSDIERKIDKTEAKLGDNEKDSKLKKQLMKLREKSDELESKINEMDDSAEEQWAQTKDDVEKKFNELKKEIENL